MSLIIQEIVKDINTRIKNVVEKTGISESRIKELDNDSSSVTSEELTLLALALEVDRRDLFRNTLNNPIPVYNTLSYFGSHDNQLTDRYFGHVRFVLSNNQSVDYPISFHEYEKIMERIDDEEYMIETETRKLSDNRFLHFRTMNNKLVFIKHNAFESITFYSDDHSESMNEGDAIGLIPPFIYPFLQDLIYGGESRETEKAEKAILDYLKHKVGEKLNLKEMDCQQNHDAIYNAFCLKIMKENETIVDEIDSEQSIHAFMVEETTGFNALRSKYLTLNGSETSYEVKVVRLLNSLLIEVPLHLVIDLETEIENDLGFTEAE